MIGIIAVGGGMRGIFGAPRAVRLAVIFAALPPFCVFVYNAEIFCLWLLFYGN